MCLVYRNVLLLREGFAQQCFGDVSISTSVFCYEVNQCCRDARRKLEGRTIKKRGYRRCASLLVHQKGLILISKLYVFCSRTRSYFRDTQRKTRENLYNKRFRVVAKIFLANFAMKISYIHVHVPVCLFYSLFLHFISWLYLMHMSLSCVYMS